MLQVQNVNYGLLSVSDQIRRVSESNPQAVALKHGDYRLLYSELDRKADRFAGYLARLGIVSGSTGAICMERSLDWVVAALGIMRAGAAFVPLDTAWPDYRLSFALKNCGVAVLVANSALVDRHSSQVCAIDPDRDAELIASAPEISPLTVGLDSLAYIIYTSGSSGNPKGVEITHANLANLTCWHGNAFNISASDRTSHLAGLGFDAAAWELWPNLCAGATVCIAPDAVRSSPGLLQQWLLHEGITVAFVPTVHAPALMSLVWPASTPLRFMLTGGDVLRQSPPPGLPFKVVNNYGPTECAVVATSSVLRPGATEVPPIGRPITGVSVYLLDERGLPAVDGAIGEIYIGGEGVGRGYRNWPDSTTRCFLPDPFAAKPGSRMYRTGDRGKWRSDGQLEFCGRLDRQVKIRGQRVELDEIANVLNRHPAIEFATVNLKASSGTEDQLVAYLLPKECTTLPTAMEFRRYLLDTLPDYMVPAVFMQLNSLPLSPNAKVDLSLLSRPSTARALESSAEARTEAQLLTIFRDILHEPGLTSDDNFFLAGGHSLLGMQLIARLRAMFCAELNFQEIFDSPTVRTLAPLVDARSRENRLSLIWQDLLGKQPALNGSFFAEGGDAILLAAVQRRINIEFGRNISLADLFDHPTIRRQSELIERDGRHPSPLPPGVFVLHRHGTRPRIFWLHTLPTSLAQELGDDQPFFFVTFTDNDIQSLSDGPSLKDVADYTVKKILAVQPQGPYILGGTCVGSILAYEVASQLRAAGQKVSLLLLLDAPTQPYLKSSRSLATRLRHPRYYLYRTAQVGWRTSLTNFLKRAARQSPSFIRSKLATFQKHGAHMMIENAAFDYQPERYEGNAVLLLAKERDPLFDFLPGWKSLVSNLSVFYVPGRHRALVTPQNVREIAGIIQSAVSELLQAKGAAVPDRSWTATA